MQLSLPHQIVRPIAILAVVAQSFARADEQALETPQGTPLKIITREPTALHREADAASPGEPLDAFTWAYVLPADSNRGDEKTRDGFYRVAFASRAARQAGWLAADKVVEWPHAQVAGFTGFGQRDRVLFFETLDDATAWYRGEPDAERRAVSREPDRKQSALFPLLGIHSIEHDGESIEVFELAYLSGQSASPALADAAPKSNPEAIPRNAEELRRDFVLQVVFVVDSTASMQPWIDAMKEVMMRITREVSNIPTLKGRVEFGLIAYRDQIDPSLADAVARMEYVSKLYCDLTADHDAFRATLETLRAAEVGSEDFPEDGLAGLNTAIRDPSWKKGAFKHIVLIGDAPFHIGTDSYKNVTKSTIPGIVALAQPTGGQATWSRMQIHGLRIVSELADITKKQFDDLTAGRDFAGLHHAYAAQGDEEKFVTELSKKLSEFAAVTATVVAGDLDKIEKEAEDDHTSSDRRKVLGPVLDMIRATRGGSAEPTFQQGFAVVLDREGNRALEPHVLVSQAQLKLYSSAVGHCVVSLETAGDPGSRDVQKIVKSLQILATGINLKEDVHPDTPLAEILSRVLGFPVRNPIFEMTPKKLAAMTAADFKGWTDQVRASQDVCRAHLENGPIWFALGRTPEKSHHLHAFLKVADLP